MTKEMNTLMAEFTEKKDQLTGLEKHRIISEAEYRNLPEEYQDLASVAMGGTALMSMLAEVNMEELIAALSEEVASTKGQRRKKSHEAPQSP